MLGKPPKYPGRKSRLAVLKEIEAAGNDFRNEGKPWSPEDLDEFLTLYLWGRGEAEIARRLGRSWKSVDTYRWKVAAGYGNAGQARCTAARKLKPWNEREVWFLRVAHEKGFTPAEIARRMGRSESSVAARVSLLQQSKKKGFAL